MPEPSGSNRPSMEPLDIPDDTWEAAVKEMEPAEAPTTPAEPEAAVAETPETPAVAEVPPTPEPVTPAEPEAISASQTIENVLAELEAIKAKLPEPKPEPAAAPPIPEAIRAALEYQDEANPEAAATIQSLGRYVLEELGGLKSQVEPLVAANERSQIERVAEEMEPLIEAAVEKFGLSDAEEGKVVDYLSADPTRAVVLTFEEGIQRVFPGRQPKAAAPVPSPAPTTRPQPGQPLTAGAAAAPPPRTAPAKPNQSIEEFVDDAFAKLNWR